MPALEGLATAVPPHRVRQEELRDAVDSLFLQGHPAAAKVRGAFDNSGITWRHFAHPIEWYLQPHGWKDRAEAYATEGLRLLERCTRDVLEAANVPPDSVDAVVLVSTTGIATPSLDARLATGMGLPPEIIRMPLWGLGCAGGVAGLNRAADLARAHPEKRVLLLTLELCSLSFRPGDRSKKSLIATTLFADGAAAALIAGDRLRAEGPRIRAGAAHTWPGTRDVMGWTVEDDGLDVVFSADIPRIVTDEMAGVVEPFLKAHTGGARPSRYVFHPGGTKVLTAYETALGLPPHALDATRRALADHGNMSSPSVLFALKESLRQPLAPGETALLAALGPGFSSELSLLEG